MSVERVNRGNLNLVAETSADMFRDWPTSRRQYQPYDSEWPQAPHGLP